VDVLHVAAEIVRQVTGMAWTVGWGLVLGFAVSGAIQAFVSKARITERFGAMDYFSWDHTTFLNLVMLPLGAWLAWVGRHGG
jgi:hypothetical protein